MPYMVVSFPLASNDLIIRWSYPLIIHDVTLLLFLVRRLKAWVLMQINMAVSKVDIYKIHPKNLHISRIKAILTVVFLKYLQARY